MPNKTIGLERDLYKKLKLLLRFEIIKNIKLRFDKKLNLIGEILSIILVQILKALESDVKKKMIKKILTILFSWVIVLLKV